MCASAQQFEDLFSILTCWYSVHYFFSPVGRKITSEQQRPLSESLLDAVGHGQPLGFQSSRIGPVKSGDQVLHCGFGVDMRSHIVAIAGWIGQLSLNHRARFVEEVAKCARKTVDPNPVQYR